MAKNTDGFRRVQRFGDVFFPKINESQRSPFHPKWRQVNLAVRMKGWKRFEPADQRLSPNQ
jgi:uncharacterized protein